MKNNHPVVIILAVLAPIFVAGFFASLKKYDQLAAEVRRQSAEISRLAEEKASLQHMLSYFSFKTNIEREARLRLNMSREGEIMVILISPKPSPGISPTPAPKTFITRFIEWWRSL